MSDPTRLAQIAETLSQDAAVGRLRQVCERWIYTACLSFGLDTHDQRASGFGYAFSVYQAEYSRNLLFRNGFQMEKVFDAVVDRTRSRLDVPAVRTLFGAKARPHRDRVNGASETGIVIERPRHGLTWFKVHFGLLQAKAYTKGEHVLRLEATVHNTRELRTGRVLEKFPLITTALHQIADRLATILDCVDTGFIPDQLLDELPAPTRLGATRIGGIDLNKPRIRTALAAALALAATPGGFTVADFAAKATRLGGTAYTIRQAAYDLRKLRGKHLIDKPGRTRSYLVPPHAARTITGLLTLRDKVIAPILAGLRSPRPGRKPATWTQIDRDYEKIRIDMQTLFRDLHLQTGPLPA